jgi:hypothetical protein
MSTLDPDRHASTRRCIPGGDSLSRYHFVLCVIFSGPLESQTHSRVPKGPTERGRSGPQRPCRHAQRQHPQDRRDDGRHESHPPEQARPRPGGHGSGVISGHPCGTFQSLTPALTINLRDAMVIMIIVSDSTCTGTVADMVGLDVINDFSQRIVVKGTTHRHGSRRITCRATTSWRKPSSPPRPMPGCCWTCWDEIK